MSETKQLQGKVAVITGGTTGIGLAAAKLFVKEGACVFVRDVVKRRSTRPCKQSEPTSLDRCSSNPFS
jgi:NAD(P)-dependent dehydrogenase (short-subunit alcohol dehydrogenase family)